MNSLIILLASESKIKKDAVNNFFTSLGFAVTLVTVNCDGCNLPPQPIEC